MHDGMIDTQLRAMADPTRRAILKQLASGGEISAGEVAAGFEITRPAVSRHLRVLLDAGLIIVRKEAQSRLYSADPSTIDELRAWFVDYWDTALPRLKHVVERDKRGRK
ncbi:ArsR/SmtB family transcription factor [Hoeflea sp.]|uniref:ArsR/SmtB family transcription factor n=1 Tax=Hoeflea sp. TaxID=1940281 RepID=UPI003B02258D